MPGRSRRDAQCLRIIQSVLERLRLITLCRPIEASQQPKASRRGPCSSAPQNNCAHEVSQRSRTRWLGRLESGSILRPPHEFVIVGQKRGKSGLKAAMEHAPKLFGLAWILQIPQVPVETAARHRISAGTKRRANERNIGVHSAPREALTFCRHQRSRQKPNGQPPESSHLASRTSADAASRTAPGATDAFSRRPLSRAYRLADLEGQRRVRL